MSGVRRPRGVAGGEDLQEFEDLFLNRPGFCRRSVPPGSRAATPRIRVVYEDLDVSGMSHWNRQQWIISIAKTDSLARRRFTLLGRGF